jgi:colicin import membrane protein
MRSLEGFVLPALVTLLLHAGVLVLVSANWTPEHERLVKPIPRHVKAKVVTLDKAAAKAPAKAAQPRPQPKVEPKPKPQPKVEPKPKPKPTPKPQPKPQPKPKPEPKPQAKPEAKPQAKPEPKPDAKAREQEIKRQRERELALALAAEDEVMQAETDSEVAMTYADAIESAIVDNWSRPPSARRDMEVTLLIQLIPTGEVVSVSVLKSSGNAAFDRSAINAVNKAARFPEVADAPPQVFEQYLRKLRLVFRPEDLRL